MKLSTLLCFICRTKMVVLFVVLLVSLGVIFPIQLNAFSCKGNPNHTRITASTSAIQWGEMTLRILKGTQGGSPTYNSRCLGYLGVAMYECVVASSPTKKSLAGQLNGLTSLPKIDTKQNYNWVLVLNAGQAALLKDLYEQTSQANKNSIDSLEKLILTNELKKTNFIFYNVTTLWDLYWLEPPFLAVYPGHAVQGAAMATVLEEMYGKNFSFTDDSHVGRPNDPIRLTAYPVRNFRSFWAAAEESAMSRFYGGIHTNQDNKVGLEEGKKIGTNINLLTWTK